MDAALPRLSLALEGLACGGCAARAERTLAAIDGVASASVSFATRTADLAYDPGRTDTRSLAEALARAGFGVAEEVIALKVAGLTCGGCARKVERALAAVPGVIGASVNAASGLAEVRVARGAVEPGALIAAVERAGYRAAPLAAPEDGRASAERRQRALLVLSLLAAVPFLVDMVAHLAGGHLLPGWLQLALAAPVQFLAGARFYAGTWRALRARAGTMDQLVALGTTAAFALSAWHLVAGGPLYFEASVLVIAFVLFGKALEERAKRSAAAAIEALARLRPAEAVRLEAEGRERRVPVSALRPGDLIRVRPGEAFPADGVIAEGETEADESLVTGESLPVPKRLGDAVVAGAVNGSGSVVVRVSAVGEGTLLGRILARVRAAQASKAPVQALVDRVAAVFVPAVLLLALATLVCWLAAGAGVDRAVVTAVSVLVVACPCALGLATPAALVAGVGAAARRGILIRDAATLERARGLDTVVFDKTGTLTEGKPEVVAVRGEDGVLALAAALQTASAHPFASAILRAAERAGAIVPPVAEARTVPGQGVRGVVDGREVGLGNARLAAAFAADLAPFGSFVREAEGQGATVVFLVEPGRALGAIALADPIRPRAAEAVAQMRALGCEPILLTGDAVAPARAVADAVGIARIEAEVDPEAKADRIAGLRRAGRCVAMVGDGVNDTAALAEADLGIAMGGGADSALAAAPVALLRPDPVLAAEAIALARATLATVRGNLVFAFAYNVAALPLAAAGYLSPAVAGAAMALSSVSVVGNAVLLARRGRAIGMG
ncbi:heavy metal translocating P-type ATPase [Elioraea thermophila]|uniref:heavy metal translocating P-type ATPase n=1 Tax=Elioraea thermophila TaxID=2185104 RepID=UPI000DF45DE0|nr:heavy metal translocating P-type ATPase [Elioraea thermophila]